MAKFWTSASRKKAVDTAIAMFSGEQSDTAREIWLVDPAPAVIAKLESAVTQLDAFMHSQGLTCAPEDVNNLKGDEARCQVHQSVQRGPSDLKTMH